LGTAGNEQTLKEAARNWNDGKMKRQNWKYTESLVFFNSVIFIHKLGIIRKEHDIRWQIFSAAILPGNHIGKDDELFWDTVYVV